MPSGYGRPMAHRRTQRGRTSYCRSDSGDRRAFLQLGEGPIFPRRTTWPARDPVRAVSWQPHSFPACVPHAFAKRLRFSSLGAVTRTPADRAPLFVEFDHLDDVAASDATIM